MEAPESATSMYLKPLLERASVKPEIIDVKPKLPARTRRVTVESRI